MKHLILTTTFALAAAALAGCSGFKLGGALYCPYGQACSATVAPPSHAASAASQP